jgi:hypothetical protein
MAEQSMIEDDRLDSVWRNPNKGNHGDGDERNDMLQLMKQQVKWIRTPKRIKVPNYQILTQSK